MGAQSPGDGLPEEVVARAELSDSGVDLTTDVLATWASGATAQVHVSMAEHERQWLTVRGERGEIELPDQPYTASWTLPVQLLISDGTGTERLDVEPADPVQADVRADLGGIPGRTGLGAAADRLVGDGRLHRRRAGVAGERVGSDPAARPGGATTDRPNDGGSTP